MIPKILHFINLGPREFSLLHYLSMISAHTVHKPDKIYLYCDHNQTDNFYWDILKDILTIEKVTGTEYHKGIYLDSYQYRADTLRLEKLLERGGVYMDLDIISMKPIDCFLDNSLVMGAESADDPNETDINKIGSITNAIILAEPNNPFLQHWYNEMEHNIVGKPWAYHAVCLPKILLASNSYNVNIQPKKIFMPFCFRDTFMLEDNVVARNKEYILNDAHTVHMWETIWKHGWLDMDINYFNTKNNLFVKYFGKYIDILYSNIDKLETIINNCYNNKNYDKLLHYTTMYISLCNRYKQDVDMKFIALHSIAIKEKLKTQ